ncbi:MAG: hypothetical protein AB2637_15725 [Candidatus Thiodiazotropha sp.]
MTNFGANPPKRIKPWETNSGQVVRNPNLLLLRENPTWRPRQYISYLWVLQDQDNLCIGIETQAAREHTVGGTSPIRQGYGHPTLTAGGIALYGGELLFKPSLGGWMINGASGRYGRSNVPVIHNTRMRQVQRLFKELIGLNVIIDNYEVRNG